MTITANLGAKLIIVTFFGKQRYAGVFEDKTSEKVKQQ